MRATPIMVVCLVLIALGGWIGQTTPLATRVPNATVPDWQCISDGGIKSVWHLEGGGYRIRCHNNRIIFSSTGGW